MLKAASLTDRGRVRPNNEDSLYADEGLGLFIVADGMGGHRAGEVASRMAVEGLSSFIRERLSPFLSPEETRKLLLEAVLAVHETIREAARKERGLRGMGTTVSLALLKDGGVWLVHVGDSRMYLVSERGIEQLTEDHSVAAQMAKAGMIAPEEAKTHENRHLLTQAVGSSPFIIPDVDFRPWRAGECLVLCSDGLTEMVEEEEIRAAVLGRSPEEACARLVALANERGGVDNVTVIVLCKEGDREARP